MRFEETCPDCGRITVIEAVVTERSDLDSVERWMREARERHQYHAHLTQPERELTDLVERKYTARVNG